MKEEKNYEQESATNYQTPTNKAPVEVPSVRLSPEQIEEINTDDYSLILFNATRVQPLSLAEIKRYFVESEPKKAEAVMERFLKVSLVHKTEDGKFYSNFPDNYINYSDYRYDGDLEAKKDAKVYQLMKEYSGKKEYWKDKSYFSIDAFFTDEQSKEIQEMLKEVRVKAKQFANDNDKIGVKGLKFRRFKYYDMFWAIALFALTFSLTCFNSSSMAFAHVGGSGNDPVGAAFVPSKISEVSSAKVGGGSGNDPTASFTNFDVSDAQGGGGGHDPENASKCVVAIGDKVFNGIFNEEISSCVISVNDL